MIGLATGREDDMSLTLNRVQKLTTNRKPLKISSKHELAEKWTRTKK